MSLQDIFYLASIIFIFFFMSLVIYAFVVINSIKQKVELIAVKTKNVAEDLKLAQYSLKAGILKMFLSILGSKGGEKYEE